MNVNSIAHRLKKLSPVLIFDITFIFGYVVWCSTPGYLFYIYFIPQVIFRGVYYLIGRAIVTSGYRLNKICFVPGIVIQALYLLFSFSVMDGADTSTGVFFSLINLPINQDAPLALSVLLLITLIYAYRFYVPKANAYESSRDEKIVKSSLFYQGLAGFILYPLLSVLFCLVIFLSYHFTFG